MISTFISTGLAKPRQFVGRISGLVTWAGIARLFAAAGAAAVIGSLAYLAAVNRGATVWIELAAGVAAGLMIVFCCLLWIRKRLSAKSRWAIGSVPNWRRAHYWAGALVLPLAFWHSGMRWGGPVERILIAVLIIVVLSGVAGYLLQVWEKLAGKQTHPSKQAAADSLQRFTSIWPLVHVPLCMALLLLLVVHVVKALYY